MSHECTIAPAILVATFEEFTASVKKIEGIFDHAQIDVMDGQFVPSKSFGDVEKINALATPVQWELHLMVHDALGEMKKWAQVKGVFRVIWHTEAVSDHAQCLAYARSQGWQTGMALNPDTPLSAVEPYYAELDVVQFMTVYPGQYGAPFVAKVGDKIQAFTKLPKRPLCAVDGAASAQTIPLLKSWGVEIYNVGSALMKVDDIKKTYQELRLAITT